MTISPVGPGNAPALDRTDAQTFIRLLLSTRELEWQNLPNGSDVALLDRRRGAMIVTDRDGFEHARGPRAIGRR